MLFLNFETDIPVCFLKKRHMYDVPANSRLIRQYDTVKSLEREVREGNMSR